MQKTLVRARRWRFVWIPVLMVASLGLMAVRAIPATYIERREAAQRRNSTPDASPSRQCRVVLATFLLDTLARKVRQGCLLSASPMCAPPARISHPRRCAAVFQVSDNNL